MVAGDIEAARKNWPAAIAAYRGGLERGQSAEVATRLYDALRTAGGAADAERFASDWIKAHPQDWVMPLHLGEVATARQDFSNAEKYYVIALQLQPENAPALNNLAWILHKTKKPGAAEYAERALAINPWEAAFLDTMAAILADRGDVEKALDLERSAVESRPDRPQYRLSLAKLYLLKGDKGLARAQLETLSKLGSAFPAQPEVAQLLGSL